MPPPAARPGRPDPLIGSVVAGRYRIEARIASGGMGTVYRAEQLGLERQVALKLLHAAALEGTEDSQSESDFEVLEKRFSREAAILARLSHPNVVTIFDYGSVDEHADELTRPRFYMAMELLGGETLHDRIATRKKIPVEEAIPLARQIARGLREAHAQGIVHRDLKPANIMIVRDRDGDEVVKLLDFGIGKVVRGETPGEVKTDDPRADLTQEGRFVGSPMYMAPEQIAHGSVDLRADIYSFGTVLYRCVAGVHPFHKDNTALVMLAHLHEKPIPLTDRVPEAPRWLGDLIDRCMAKEPGKRPASMEEILRLFNEQAPTSLPTNGARAAPFDPLPLVEAGPTIASGKFETLATPHTTSRPAMITGTQTSAMLPAQAPSRTPWIVSGVVLAITAFLVVFFVARDKPQPVAAAPPAASPTVSVASTFVVTIESTPTNADVLEGGVLVGRTPMQLTVAKGGKARTFVVSKAGFVDASIAVPPPEHDVKFEASLEAAAAPSATASTTTKPVVKITPTKPSATTTPPLDIIPKR